MLDSSRQSCLVRGRAHRTCVHLFQHRSRNMALLPFNYRYRRYVLSTSHFWTVDSQTDLLISQHVLTKDKDFCPFCHVSRRYRIISKRNNLKCSLYPCCQKGQFPYRAGHTADVCFSGNRKVRDKRDKTFRNRRNSPNCCKFILTRQHIGHVSHICFLIPIPKSA